MQVFLLISVRCLLLVIRSVGRSVGLYVCLSFYLSVCSPVCLSVGRSFGGSICLSIDRSDCGGCPYMSLSLFPCPYVLVPTSLSICPYSYALVPMSLSLCPCPFVLSLSPFL